MRRRAAIAFAGTLLAVLLLASTPAQALTVYHIRSVRPMPNGAPLLAGITGGLAINIGLVTPGGDPRSPQRGPASHQWILQRRAGETSSRIVNRLSGDCLGVNGSSDNGARMVHDTCRTQPSDDRYRTPRTQGWTFRRMAEPRVPGTPYQLINAYSGKCLDITDFRYTPGTVLQQYSCSVGLNQRFYLDRLEVP